MKTQIVMIAVLSAILLALPITTHVAVAQAAGPSPPIESIINPGPSSNPSKWNASSDVADLGTSNFTFSASDIGSTFFVNLTVATNATAGLYGWEAGLVYQNATLQYVGYTLPPDNVLSGAAALGDEVLPAEAVDPYNSTSQVVVVGGSFIQGTSLWTFNGTGTLMQLEFQIIGVPNSTTPEISFPFFFDPFWSNIYYYPSGSELPQLETGMFNLETSPPTMGTPIQSPTQYAVQPNEPVYVGINVTDPTGISNVTLAYTNDTTLYDLPMTYNSTDGLYETYIPGMANGTTVNYNITAFDNNGIEAWNDNNTALWAYTVVPEFPILALPIIFAALSLSAGVIALSRKRRTVPK